MGGGTPAAAGIAAATATAADALASLLLYVAVVDEPPPAALDAALGEVRAGLTLGEFSSMPDAERAPPPPRACRRRRARWRWTRRLARRPDAPAGDEIPGAPAGAGGAQGIPPRPGARAGSRGPPATARPALPGRSRPADPSTCGSAHARRRRPSKGQRSRPADPSTCGSRTLRPRAGPTCACTSRTAAMSPAEFTSQSQRGAGGLELRRDGPRRLRARRGRSALPAVRRALRACRPVGNGLAGKVLERPLPGHPHYLPVREPLAPRYAERRARGI